MQHIKASLLNALELLSKPGVWKQGSQQVVSEKGRHCLATSLGCCDLSLVYVAAAIGIELTPRARMGYGLVGKIWDWNDAPGRTLKEVLDVLRLAILKFEDATKTGEFIHVQEATWESGSWLTTIPE
jgi:hypothetical protein